MPTNPRTVVVREGLEEVCRAFTDRVAELGFERTRKMFWTRERGRTIEFVHFFRGGSSYGAPTNHEVDIRVYCAVRVLQDPTEHLALTGIQSDATRTRAGRYHLRFNAKSGDLRQRCIDDLVRFVVDEGEPWFARVADPRALPDATDTTWPPEARDALLGALDGDWSEERAAASRELLGIRSTS